jgi:hypothetical protein
MDTQERDRLADANAYVRRIRNQAKRRYAHAYLGYLIAFPGSESPPADPPDLSYMGAQAVRIALSNLIERADQP